eukprot:m.40734 g.40734  ORF g.40734 m.40734 type:complete len:532 (-) comp9701_c0_seq2:1017-2612(-)
MSKAKKPRLNGDSPRWDVVSTKLCKELSHYTEKYNSSTPYPHVVLKDICQSPSLANGIKDELIHNLESTYKETDLFKFYQTMDLANIGDDNAELKAKMPTLMKLRAELYSPEFRKLVQDVTGCVELTDRVDMAASAYSQGCHLLCHDDVIGTRAISFIVYLTEEGWNKDDGGELELYPLQPGQEGTPHPVPSATLLPTFNTLAMFAVQPGTSFHSVQEVFSDKAPRLSIQGWFHGASPPPGNENASLSQLKANSESALEFQTLSIPKSNIGEFTPEELKYLEDFINPTYLKSSAIGDICKEFEEDSCIKLHKFLHEDVADKITKACMKADTEDSLGNGVPDRLAGTTRKDWELVGPPHMQRYQKLKNEPSEEPGSVLGSIQTLMRSIAFAKLMNKFTTLLPVGVTTEIRRFRPGLDYTVAHHGLLEKESRLDATLCFVKDIDDKSKGIWSSGDVGGFECYIAAANEEEEAAEVYCDDDAEDNDLLNVIASSNTLNLVMRDAGTMRFIKYVSAQAPSSRWDLASVYAIQDSD